LIKENWPIFLTSANISNEQEIYNKNEIKNIFWNLIENWKVKFIWENMWNIKKEKPSDIFEFIWDGLEINYLRKVWKTHI
jgi:hypothetical protein